MNVFEEKIRMDDLLLYVDVVVEVLNLVIWICNVKWGKYIYLIMCCLLVWLFFLLIWLV